MHRSIRLATPLLTAALLAACAAPPASRPPVARPAPVTPAPVSSVEFGTVRSVELIEGSAPQGTSGTGAVIGGVVGAVAGRSMGDSSRGKNVGTVIGAVGGALIGNEIEKQNQRNAATSDRLRVQVNLDRGGQRTVDTEASVDLRAGDRVRIENGRITRL